MLAINKQSGELSYGQIIDLMTDKMEKSLQWLGEKVSAFARG